MDFAGKELRRSPFVIIFILIMLKMALFRQFVFHEISFINLAADAAAVLVLLCICELASSAKWRLTVFALLNGLLSIILFAATIYASYYGTIPLYSTLSGINQVGQIKDSITSIIQAVYYLFFADLAVMIVLYIIGRVKRKPMNRSKRIARPLYVAVAALLCVAVTSGLVWKNNAIANEIVQADKLGILGYQIASAMKEKDALKDGSAESIAASLGELQSGFNYTDEAAAAGAPNYYGIAKGKNVIVVQLEAFQNFTIGLNVDGQEVTPVLNQLQESSFYFPNFFQQIGQGNTSDAEFMSNTSIYPTGTTAMSTGFGDRVIPSMPRLLSGLEQYVSNTFHVNDVTFWDRIQMYPALGFTKYYDKEAFVNDNFNGFGASDVEMYRVGLEKLGQLQKDGKPFYAQFVATSGHHPFKVPADLQRMTLSETLQGTQLGDYIMAMNYSDYALGTLIDGLKQSGMWEDTVLVVYGDHFGLQSKDNDPAWVSEQLGINYHERISRFNIPLFIHVPGLEEGKRVETVGGQVDIMPTVANLLGISLAEQDHIVFGHDLLNITNNIIGMRYYLPTGSFFNNDILFVPGEGFEDGTAYDLKTKEPIEDFSQYRSQYDYILQLVKLSDNYANSLPKRSAETALSQ